ncbi:hypothetical protein IMX07_06710 [bacterium]|nr:hypothetical protein [bacterium]
MIAKNGLIWGIFIALFASAVVVLAWSGIVRMTGADWDYMIFGGFLLFSGLMLGLVGNSLPKADYRRRVFMLSAIPGALSGVGALLVGVAHSQNLPDLNWVFAIFGLGSFISFQILFAYVLLKFWRKRKYGKLS